MDIVNSSYHWREHITFGRHWLSNSWLRDSRKCYGWGFPMRINRVKSVFYQNWPWRK